MLVYGSLFVGGMVLLGYDRCVQPNLSFFQMPWYVGMFILIFELWFVGWILESGVEVVSKVHSERPRNPLTNFGGIHGKA